MNGLRLVSAAAKEADGKPTHSQRDGFFLSPLNRLFEGEERPFSYISSVRMRLAGVEEKHLQLQTRAEKEENKVDYEKQFPPSSFVLFGSRTAIWGWGEASSSCAR